MEEKFLVFFSVLGVLCLWGIIEKILNEIIWNIEKYFYDRETKKDIKLYYKKEKLSIVIFCDYYNKIAVLYKKTPPGILPGGKDHLL